MAPCPDPKAFPTAETSLDWAAAGFTHGLMGFRLAPCLVLWNFKTDGWPPVPIPKPSPQPRPPWIELRLALPMLRQWFDGISAGTLCGFMGFQNWRMAPCPDPKAFPTAETPLDWAAAGFTHAAAMVLWALLSVSRLQRLSLSHLPTFFRAWFLRRCQMHYLNSSRQTRGPHCCTARWTLMAMLPRLHAHAAVPDIKLVAAYSAVVHLPCLHSTCHIASAKGTTYKPSFCPQRARPWREIARRADARLGRFAPCWSRPLHKQGMRIETRLRLLHWPVFHGLSRVVAYRCPFAWVGLCFSIFVYVSFAFALPTLASAFTSHTSSETSEMPQGDCTPLERTWSIHAIETASLHIQHQPAPLNHCLSHADPPLSLRQATAQWTFGSPPNRTGPPNGTARLDPAPNEQHHVCTSGTRFWQSWINFLITVSACGHSAVSKLSFQTLHMFHTVPISSDFPAQGWTFRDCTLLWTMIYVPTAFTTHSPPHATPRRCCHWTAHSTLLARVRIGFGNNLHIEVLRLCPF